MAIDRRQVAALSVSAALVVSLWVAEGYTDKAIIPVEGDRHQAGRRNQPRGRSQAQPEPHPERRGRDQTLRHGTPVSS